MRIKLPQYFLHVAAKLLNAGFQVYLVGGALRDTLLGNLPSDYDIATDATPTAIQKLFPNSLEVGAQFGTIIVPVKPKFARKYYNIEITTMRKERQYKDFRHPQVVTFIKDIKEDLSRRDFTINAMAMDLSSIKNLPKQLLQPPINTKLIEIDAKLIDPFGGLKDLENKIIRAVGDPKLRFLEDPLRTLRACRFAAQLEFTIEPKTKKAIVQTVKYLANISSERIRDELVKILTKANKPSRAFECMRETGMLTYVLPELLATIGAQQPVGHIHDVYTHLLAVTDKAPKHLVVRLAALLHDIAKPQTALPSGNFYGHDLEGAKMARKILRRLNFPNRITDKVAHLIRWHMFHYQPNVWTDAAVRRFIRNVGLENIPLLFKLRLADALANPKQPDPRPIIKAFKQHIEKVLTDQVAFKRSDLDISGHDIIKALKIKPGPDIGKILDYLLEQVLDNPQLNKKSKLIKLAKQYAKENLL